MGPLGIPELLFILVLALLIFGPKKLPEIGKTLGRAMGEFRRATTDLKRSIDTEMRLEEDKSLRPTPAPAPAGTAAREGGGASEPGAGGAGQAGSGAAEEPKPKEADADPAASTEGGREASA